MIYQSIRKGLSYLQAFCIAGYERLRALPVGFLTFWFVLTLPFWSIIFALGSTFITSSVLLFLVIALEALSYLAFAALFAIALVFPVFAVVVVFVGLFEQHEWAPLFQRFILFARDMPVLKSVDALLFGHPWPVVQAWASTHFILWGLDILLIHFPAIVVTAVGRLGILAINGLRMLVHAVFALPLFVTRMSLYAYDATMMLIKDGFERAVLFLCGSLWQRRLFKAVTFLGIPTIIAYGYKAIRSLFGAVYLAFFIVQQLVSFVTLVVRCLMSLPSLCLSAFYLAPDRYRQAFDIPEIWAVQALWLKEALSYRSHFKQADFKAQGWADYAVALVYALSARLKYPFALSMLFLGRVVYGLWSKQAVEKTLDSMDRMFFFEWLSRRSGKEDLPAVFDMHHASAWQAQHTLQKPHYAYLAQQEQISKGIGLGTSDESLEGEPIGFQERLPLRFETGLETGLFNVAFGDDASQMVQQWMQACQSSSVREGR